MSGIKMPTFCSLPVLAGPREEDTTENPSLMYNSLKRIWFSFCLLLCLLSPAAIAATQYGVRSWGLDRVDQRLGTNTTYTYDYDGSNTIIYILDTGVAEVSDLSGRILEHRAPTKCPDDVSQPHDICFTYPDDLYAKTPSAKAHGTKVASIAAGTTYGVAKGALIVDMRIYSYGTVGQSGSCVEGQIQTSCVIWALNDIAARHPSNMKGVVNISSTVGAASLFHSEIYNALSRVLGRGLTVVVAATEAGNAACSETPSEFGDDFDGLITVSAIEPDDRLAVDEARGNIAAGTGACVDIFAPSKTLAMNYDGTEGLFEHTSSATPFVSGAAALVYQQNPWMTGQEVEIQLKENSTQNLLGNIPGDTTNALVYTRLGVAVTMPPPPLYTAQSGTASILPIPGATYHWTIANGTIIGSNTGSSITFTTGCSVKVYPKVTITTSDGQQISATGSAQVLASTARVNSTNATINYGQSTTLALVFTGTGPWTVTWQDGLQQTYSTYNAIRTVTPAETTTYRLLSMSDGAGCAGTVSGYTTVTVNGCSPANATVSTPSVNFSSGVQFASVTPVSGATYWWTITNGSILSGWGQSQVQYYVGCSGTATVNVTITKSCGTQSSGTASVAITKPTAVVSGSQTIFSSQSAIIQGTYNGTAGGWITWSDGEQQFNLYPGGAFFREVTPSSTMTYSVIEVRDNRGCFGTASGSTTVTVQ